MAGAQGRVPFPRAGGLPRTPRLQSMTPVPVARHADGGRLPLFLRSSRGPHHPPYALGSGSAQNAGLSIGQRADAGREVHEGWLDAGARRHSGGDALGVPRLTAAHAHRCIAACI